MPPRDRNLVAALSPGPIAEELFCLDPDRDERAPQLCAETLLTLVQNGYKAPATSISCDRPKRQRFAVRSLALGRELPRRPRRRTRRRRARRPPPSTGRCLARGSDLRGSANLRSLSKHCRAWSTRKPSAANKPAPGCCARSTSRCCGTTPARRARTQPSTRSARSTCAGAASRSPGCSPTRPTRTAPDLGRAAVAGDPRRHSPATARWRRSAHGSSRRCRADEIYSDRPMTVEQDEKEAWEQGASPRLADLASRLCRHAEGVMLQGGASGPAKLWQLRMHPRARPRQCTCCEPHGQALAHPSRNGICC